MGSLKAVSKTADCAPASAILGACSIAMGIYALTEQSASSTVSLSETINQVLAKLIGWVPGLYDEASRTWLGTDIRHWAHTVEFAALGTCVAKGASGIARGTGSSGVAESLAVCAMLSFFDQCHKTRVPFRHFDSSDLVMDALGYVPAVALVMAFSRQQA